VALKRSRLLSGNRTTGGISERHQPISKASDAQRDKVQAIGECAVQDCRGAHAIFNPIAPAHLWPRSMGGGDDPLDVVPLCREHHRQLDRHELDLLRHLIPRYALEVAKAVERANGDVVAVAERLASDEIVWRSTLETRPNSDRNRTEP
jgi:hypothetical protein